MLNCGQMYCFRANYQLSDNFNPNAVPDWLHLESNWQGYRISTVPWIVDVARALGVFPIEDDTLDAWIKYLQSLGLKEITPVCCEEFFADKLFS